MECPICKKEFVSETGRRPKKFCSDACKVKFWNAFKKVNENNKPENKARIEAERNGSPRAMTFNLNPMVVKDFKSISVEEEKPPMPQNLEELKSLCPKDLKGFDKSEWISKERQKYNL